MFRAFSRVYVLIMPVLYGPYYAYIVEEAEHSGDDPDRALLFAILFACAVQLASAGLVNLMIALEDPFAQKTRFAGNFDRIRVSEIAEATAEALAACRAAGRRVGDRLKATLVRYNDILLQATLVG